MPMTLASIRETVYLDFEFQLDKTGRPRTVCLVAREHKSRRLFRCWMEDTPRRKPPFAVGPDVLVVAYFASAEMGCYLALGWELPRLVLDLYPEFRVLTNGYSVPGGNGLLGALQWFGLSAIDGAKKDYMRERILAGGTYSADEQRAILDYCQSDVDSLALLFPKLIKANQDLGPCLWRGEYMKAIARAEHAGIPLDAALYQRMGEHWPVLQATAIDRVNETIPVFDGRVFRMSLFERWLESQGLLEDWPLTPDGSLAADDDTLRRAAMLRPQIEPLREVRHMLAQLKKLDISVGSDGRNRCLLSPFATKTGRNAPSTTKFIFGVPSFLRGLIQPPVGRALAYVDWEQQEFGIAAALSGDGAMQQSYRSGDPYLAFAKLAKVVPADATDKTHPTERDLFKTTVLGVQYQIGTNGLAYRLGVTVHEAQNLLDYHHKIFCQFWRWSDAACDYAQLCGGLTAAFGWQLHFTAGTNLRTMRNFPMQANGAEMMRLACVYTVDAGVNVLASVHDALVIEAEEPEIKHAVQLTQTAMRKASKTVLAGFPLRSDAKIIRYPERFPVKKGAAMWSWMQDTLGTL
jgi:hypothetical protein